MSRFVQCSSVISRCETNRAQSHETEWILFTSGTTGVPKMVVHSLASLAGAIAPAASGASPVVWATFYDIRRYGGLQILLRAILGGGSLVLSGPTDTTDDFLSRAQLHAATHITGTPSHWRKALMSPAARHVKPQYARLSGEIADQAILDHLQAFYPHASIAHAFASTEGGVAFEVGDGRAGFPATFIGRADSGVELKVENDTLHIRSPRAARRYVGNETESLLDPDGFVDTGDVLELRGDRYHFVGRRGGIINVGGLKIHPEEVEAVINRQPGVRMSLVKARKSPITGAIVAADVVPMATLDGPAAVQMMDALKSEILDALSTRPGTAQSAGGASLRSVARGDPVRKDGAARCIVSSSPEEVADSGSASRSCCAPKAIRSSPSRGVRVNDSLRR